MSPLDNMEADAVEHPAPLPTPATVMESPKVDPFDDWMDGGNEEAASTSVPCSTPSDSLNPFISPCRYNTEKHTHGIARDPKLQCFPHNSDGAMTFENLRGKLTELPQFIIDFMGKARCFTLFLKNIPWFTKFSRCCRICSQL